MSTIENTNFSFFIENFIAYPTLENYKNVIFKIKWRLTGEYLNYKSELDKYSDVSTDNITDFVPFEELKKENVIDWIEAVEDINSIKNAIINDINKQINPDPPSTVILVPAFNQ